ncbi:MAG: methyltransferase [Thermodesulfovibrionales bacterium]
MVPEDLAWLRKLYLGFIASRVVLTANNLGFFDCLKKPATAEAVAKKLGIDNRGASILLDALTGIGLAAKSRDGKYRNTAVSSHYLVRGAPLYQGDIVRHASSMWDNFSGLDEVVRTGKPDRRGRDHEAFIRGMHNLTLLRTKGLIKAMGLKGVRTMLDLGGGPGTNAMAISKHGVKATVFDLPATIAIARKVARQEGVRGLRFIKGDFHIDDIGSGYDLILISQIFHAYSPGENMDLLRKCRKALNPGGRVVVQEFPINDALTAPPHGALFSVNMLAGTKSGRCYSPAEMKKWLATTGFSRIRVSNLEETVLVEGRTKAGQL